MLKAGEVSLSDVVLAGSRDDHFGSSDLNRARLGVQRGIVEDRAQPAFLAELADRRDDVGLVEIVGEQIDLGGLVVLAILDEVEQQQACVGAKPFVLRRERLGVERR